MPAYIVYCITNMIEDKAYIGITQRPLSVRWKCHVYDSKRYDYPISQAIRRYGPEAFRVTVLCEVNGSREELRQREKTYIALFDTTNPKCGYNLSSGGEGCGGFKMPREIVERLAAKQRGCVRSAETRHKQRMAKLGTKRTSESIEKAAARRRGMKYPPEWRANMSAAQRHRGRGVNQLADGQWQARITTDAGRLYLGTFREESKAIAAREAALAKEKNFEPVH